MTMSLTLAVNAVNFGAPLAWDVGQISAGYVHVVPQIGRNSNQDHSAGAGQLWLAGAKQLRRESRAHGVGRLSLGIPPARRLCAAVRPNGEWQKAIVRMLLWTTGLVQNLNKAALKSPPSGGFAQGGDLHAVSPSLLGLVKRLVSPKHERSEAGVVRYCNAGAEADRDRDAVSLP